VETRTVIGGGGVLGGSVASHVACSGDPQVLLVEQGKLGAATTSCSAGLLGQVRPTRPHRVRAAHLPGHRRVRGRAPEVAGLVVASGGSGLGVTRSGGIGAALAGLLLDGRSALDLEPFRVDPVRAGGSPRDGVPGALRGGPVRVTGHPASASGRRRIATRFVTGATDAS
jgi:glycine/D-amino acid oxidase-like deaminating enzyme